MLRQEGFRSVNIADKLDMKTNKSSCTVYKNCRQPDNCRYGQPDNYRYGQPDKGGSRLTPPLLFFLQIGGTAEAGAPSFRRKPESREIAMNRQPAVYILASKRNGTLYVGVTSDLVKRIWAHKNNMVEGFTKRYGVHHLVWFEIHDNMESAIKREKQIKEWQRKWKLELIESKNADWQDLYHIII